MLTEPETRAVVVGTLHEVGQLDVHGYAAVIEVERDLAGSLASGARVRLGWEELSRGRAPRFADGDRVVVALAELPTWSLWRKRFPDPADTFAVAAQGDAFLRAPDDATLAGLARLLGAEDDRARLAALAGMVRAGDPALAGTAAALLDADAHLDDRLSGAARGDLSSTLADPTRPETLRARVLALAASHRMVELRPAVVALTRAPGPLEAPAWDARAALDGALSSEQVAALLGRSEPALRVVAVRHARGTASEPDVPALVTADASPDVRATAAVVWVEWKGEAGVEAAVPALFDPHRPVRGRVAQAIAQVGSPVVPRMLALLDGADPDRAVGPVTVLRYAGPQGVAALRQQAGAHADPKVRKLILFALGQEPPHD